MKDCDSFICEHTAEYVLIPALLKILKTKFSTVVPVFPWMTREGSSFSRNIHIDDKFQVLGLYPRRPKVNLKENKIMIKINPEFKEGAIAALKINIPMIAGCPLVKNLWELSQEAPCLWFKLNDKTLDYYQVEYDAGNMTKFNLKATQEYVNDKELLKYLQTHCKAIGFNEFIQAVPMIKQQSTGVYFMGFGSYKPIYFLLKND